MHTPKDETLNVKIGNAFDVICERKQTDFQKIATNVYEFEYEITLRNHKATPIQVEVNEPVGGTWRMITLVARVDARPRRGRRSSRCRSRPTAPRC